MTLRVARHTNNLQIIQNFYINILGFERLGGFQNHNNYHGIFIGKPDSDWHFEFTQSETEANHKFDEDDIIVLYPDTIKKYNTLLESLLENNIPEPQKIHIGMKMDKCSWIRMVIAL